MAYRYECFCKYCKRHGAGTANAKRMSIKLDRMKRKAELKKLIDEF